MSAPAPGAMLISGIEYHDGEHWRAYVNNRWMWKYVLVNFETAKAVWKIYQSVGRVEVPIPGDLEVHQVPVEDRWEGAEAEKEIWERTRASLE